MENKLGFFFRNQIWHIGGLIILFYLGCQLVDFKNNSNIFLGVSAKSWFLFSMMTPLLHQGYVWLCWRSELCWKAISRTIGFKAYAVIFIIIMILRLSSIGLCFADYGTWFTPGWIAWSVSVLIFIPFIYTIYSVKKYFGFMRAAGIDHFDPSYKDIPFERRGIFKWNSNAMYTFAITVFFGFAISAGSKAMLVFATYTYIGGWLHYFCTEREDFKVIYGNNQVS
jgi:protein-S-isoprenylcysteine O-methyltransferase Ste14